jgi:hypothetical protein
MGIFSITAIRYFGVGGEMAGLTSKGRSKLEMEIQRERDSWIRALNVECKVEPTRQIPASGATVVHNR